MKIRKITKPDKAPSSRGETETLFPNLAKKRAKKGENQIEPNK